MDDGDPLADHKQALLDLSDGLRDVAETLRWDANPGDTAAAMIKLGPTIVRVGETMRRLPGRGPL